MSRHVLRFMAFFIVSLIAISPLFAQRQVGSISGNVSDSEGNALPGVELTVSGPALMGAQSFLSSETGSFRFPSLPPGLYTLKAELSGFQPVVRENLTVAVGTALAINVTLEMATLETEMTIIADAPLIDVTQSKRSLIIDGSSIQNLPVARSFKDLLLTTSGFGGSRHHTGPGYMGAEGMVMHGSAVTENSFASDGLILNDPITMVSSLTRMNIDSVDEIEMVVGGQSAETPFSAGAFINVVTKSGGNDFSGGALLYYTGKQFVENLWSQEQLQSLGIQPPMQNEYSYDVSLNLGGPIFRDKLWFYSNLRYEEAILRGSFIEWTDPFGIFHGNYDSFSDSKTFFMKLTSQISPKLRVFGVFDYNRTLNDTGEYEPGPYQLQVETNYYDQWRLTSKIQATYIFSQDLFLDVSVGYVNRHFPSLSQVEGAGRPWIRDYATPYGSFTGRARDSLNIRKVFTAQSDVAYFKENFLFGADHELKVGVRFEINPCGYDNWYPSNLNWYWYDGPYYFGRTTWKGVSNVGWGRIHYQDMGAYEGSVYTPRLFIKNGIYIQDAITFNKRLTLNLGVRLDYQTSSLGAAFKDVAGDPMSIYVGEKYVKPYTQQRWPEYFPNGINPYSYREMEAYNNIYTWIDILPRIGITYDIFGNQKTAFKASFSRYAEALDQRGLGAHPFDRRSFRYDWYDLNNNQIIDEEDDFVVYPTDYRPLSLEFQKMFVDDKLSSAKTHEYMMGIQHQLFANFVIGVSAIFKNNFNIHNPVLYSFDEGAYWYNMDQELAQKYWVPFTTVVPGFDGYPNNTVTLYARRNDAPPILSRRTNVPEYTRKYQALEVVFNKRMSDGWQLSGSVVFSKSYGNIGGYYREGVPTNPNGFVNRFGRLAMDVPLFIKLTSSFDLGKGFMFSAYYRHFDGEPWGRTAQIRPPANWCAANNVSREYYSVYIEPPDTRRYKSYDFLDFRIDKTLVVSKFGKLTLSADIYNLLGYRSITVGEQDIYRYEPSAENVLEPQRATLQAGYKKVNGAQGLRTVHFSLRFNF